VTQSHTLTDRVVLIFKLNNHLFSDYFDQVKGFSDSFNRDYSKALE
jgi:hypothetical protein